MVKEKVSKKKIIALKIYFDRARMYLGYINFFLLNVVLLNSFENPQYQQFVKEYQYFVIPVLFVIYALLLVFVGYLDTKLGFRSEEMRNNAMMNPVLTELLDTVKRIEKQTEDNETASARKPK